MVTEMTLVAGRRRRVEIPSVDNGTEVLWVEDMGKLGAKILSVPVFCYGISRGTLIETTVTEEGRAVFKRVLTPSEGATIRCYMEPQHKASDMYLARLVPEGSKRRLDFGPATFLDPDIVAIHVKVRDQWPIIGTFLDELTREGAIRFWELGDPDSSPATEEGISLAEPWKIVHPPPTSSVESYTSII